MIFPAHLRSSGRSVVDNTASACLICPEKCGDGSGGYTQAAIASEAYAALGQIDEKGYAMELAAEGYGAVHKYGIAFGGKFCVVEPPRVRTMFIPE